MNKLKIDISKLKTQSQYAKDKGLSRQRVNQLVKSGNLNTIEIQGAILIVVD